MDRKLGTKRKKTDTSPPIPQRTYKCSSHQMPDKLAEQAACSANSNNDEDHVANDIYDDEEVDEADEADNDEDDDHYNYNDHYDYDDNCYEQDSNDDNDDDTVDKQLENGMKVSIVSRPNVDRNCTFCLKPGNNNIFQVWLRNTPNICGVKISTYVLHTRGLREPRLDPCRSAFVRALKAIDLVWDSHVDIDAFLSRFDEHQDERYTHDR